MDNYIRWRSTSKKSLVPRNGGSHSVILNPHWTLPPLPPLLDSIETLPLIQIQMLCRSMFIQFWDLMESSITLRRLVGNDSIYVYIVVVPDIRQRIVSPKEEVRPEKSVLRSPLHQCHSLCLTLTPLPIIPLTPQVLWMLSPLQEKPFCRCEHPAVCGIRCGAYSIWSWSIFSAICFCSILGWFWGFVGFNSVLFFWFQFIYHSSPIDPCAYKFPILASNPHMHFDW